MQLYHVDTRPCARRQHSLTTFGSNEQGAVDVCAVTKGSSFTELLAELNALASSSATAAIARHDG